MSEIKLHSVNIFDTDGVKVSWQFQFDGVIPDSNSGTTPYLYPEDVRVQELYTDANGLPQVIDRVGTLIAANEIRVEGAPIAAGRQVRIYRATEIRFPLVDYRDRQVVSELDLDLQARQSLFVAMEVYDAADQATDASARAEQVAATALTTANSAVDTANSAEQKADAAVLSANSAVQTSGEAFDLATLAREEAAAAEEHASQVEVRADEAAAAAERAEAASVAAVEAAEEAVGVASAVDGKATTALQNSEAAVQTANSAAQVAAAIDGKATQALADSSEALSTANEASTTANAVDGKAQTALDNSAAAVQTADAATLAVDSVRTDLTATQLRVTNAETRLTAEEAATVEHNSRLVGLRTDVNALRVDVTALQAANVPRVPSKIQSGHSCVAALVEGQIWSAISNSSVYNNGGSGLGPNGSSGYFGIERLRRVPIPDISPVVDFGIFGYSGWALCANSNLYVWGHNAYGQLGLGHTTQQGVATLSRANVEAVYTTPSNMGFDAAYNKLMIKDKLTGNILTVGYNGNGQLGLADTTNRSTWTVTWDAAVRGQVKTVYNLGNGYGAAVILTTDNRMFVTGYNGHGQLGVSGTTITTWTEATSAWGGASAIAQITEIGGGFGYSDSQVYSQSYMAVLYKGVGIRTCGNNSFGSIGNGTTTSVGVPYSVPLPSPPQSWMISGGGVGTIHVLCTDQNVYTWGYGGSGNTGTGRSAGNEVSPIRVTGFPGPVRALLTNGCDRNIWSYKLPMFAQLVDGTIMSWGTNGYGEGSVGDNVTSLAPRRTLYPALDVNGKPLVALKLANLVGTTAETGASTSILFTEQGFVYATGHNGQQQITNNTSSTEAIPITITPPWRPRL